MALSLNVRIGGPCKVAALRTGLGASSPKRFRGLDAFLLIQRLSSAHIGGDLSGARRCYERRQCGGCQD